MMASAHAKCAQKNQTAAAAIWRGGMHPRKIPPKRLISEGHLFRSIRHQASLFIFSVIWLFLRAAAFL